MKRTVWVFSSTSLFWPIHSEILPMTEIISLMLPVTLYRISLSQKSFIKDSDFRFKNLTESQGHLEPDSVFPIFMKPSLIIKMSGEIALPTKQDPDTTNITLVN